MGAKAIKLGAGNKHPAYCQELNFSDAPPLSLKRFVGTKMTKIKQYAGCLSHEPGLMALVPTSLL